MKQYNIGDLVKKLEINKETIRYYEKIGMLSKPKRDESGYRIYLKEDIKKIRFIIMVKNFGFTLKEIRMLINDEVLCGDIESIKLIVEDKIKEINSKVNELEEKKKLLERVKEIISQQDIKCPNNIEMNFENKY